MAPRSRRRFAKSCARASPRSPARAGRPPGLGIVLVGTHAPSEIYVRNKLKAAADIGCRADLVRPAGISDARGSASRAVRDLNDEPVSRRHPRAGSAAGRDGAGSQAVFDIIDPAKDVDGFTPVNAGRLVQNRAHAGAVHAIGRHRAARAVQRSPSRAARRRHRPQRHRRGSRWRCCCCTPRDGDDLPLAGRGICRR